MPYKRINAQQCRQLMQEAHTLLDIRDPQSFSQGHIDGAIHMEEIHLETFIEEHPKQKPLIICCYHGNSSQSAAAYFAEKGFEKVYSLDGGYEGWS
jgi:thiosulfate sulfurtransferase